MKFIVHKRFKGKAICGEVNIPAMTEVEELPSKLIVLDGKPLCYSTSQSGHEHFCRNNDDCGLKRGKLTSEIQKKLAHRDDDYQKRWDKIWDDSLCQKYKRPEHVDHWLWNHDFFNADITDLKYIAKLVGIKEI
jgi:hypothetical protein